MIVRIFGLHITKLWADVIQGWLSLTYGHPHMIDVQDCDARLPSGGTVGDMYMDELVRLSVVLGRVLKTIYTPSGLTFTTDEMLEKLLADIEAWKANLPESLRFRGEASSLTSGQSMIIYNLMHDIDSFSSFRYPSPSVHMCLHDFSGESSCGSLILVRHISNSG